MTPRPSQSELAAELDDLRTRLADAEEVLRAIRSGDVDGVLVSGERGEEIYAHQGADRIYRQLVESMGEGAATLSANGLILYCNARVAEILARPMDQVIGTSLRRYVPPADQHGFDALLLRAITEPNRIEINLNAGDGRQVPVYLAVSCLDCAAAAITFGLVITDLTEQRSHDRVVAAERRFRALIEHGVDFISLLAADGTLLWENPSATSLLGFEPDEFVGRNIFELVHPDDADDVQRVMAQVVQQPKNTRHRVFRMRRRDGQWRWIEASATNLLDDDSVQAIVVNYRDVTERQRAEDALRLHSAALNAAANAIVITDTNGAIEWINAAFTGLTGYSRDEAIGKNSRDLVKSGVQDRAFYTHLWETILGGNVWSGEMTNRRKDGSLYPEGQTVTPVRNDQGKIAHFIAIKRDLTAHHQLEAQFQQAQKMETVGRLAGGIAHDFNNLLTVINGIANLASMNLLEGDPLRADLDEILRAGERAAALTQQLLAFSRKQIMKPQVLNVGSLVASLESMLRRLIGERIALVITSADDVGCVAVSWYRASPAREPPSRSACRGLRRWRSRSSPSRSPWRHATPKPSSSSKMNRPFAIWPRAFCGGPATPCSRRPMAERLCFSWNATDSCI